MKLYFICCKTVSSNLFSKVVDRLHDQHGSAWRGNRNAQSTYSTSLFIRRGYIHQVKSWIRAPTGADRFCMPVEKLGGDIRDKNNPRQRQIRTIYLMHVQQKFELKIVFEGLHPRYRALQTKRFTTYASRCRHPLALPLLGRKVVRGD